MRMKGFDCWGFTRLSFFHCFYPYFVILIVIVIYIWVNTNGEMNAQQISRKIVSAVFCPFSA